MRGSILNNTDRTNIEKVIDIFSKKYSYICLFKRLSGSFPLGVIRLLNRLSCDNLDAYLSRDSSNISGVMSNYRSPH